MKTTKNWRSTFASLVTKPCLLALVVGNYKPWLLLLSVHTRLSLKLLVSCCCELQMRQDWLLCTKFNAGLGQIDFSLCGDQRDCDCFCGVWVPAFFFCAILVSMFRNGPSHFIPCVIWDPFPFKILPSKLSREREGNIPRESLATTHAWHLCLTTLFNKVVEALDI